MTLAEPVATPPRRPVRWPGRAALALGILTPIAVTAGVVAVTYDAFLFATIAAWTGIGASVLAVVGGVAAAIGNAAAGCACSVDHGALPFIPPL